MTFRRYLIVFFTLLATLAAAGCSRYYYGVQEKDWLLLSDTERAEVIRLYQERRVQEERRRAAEAELRTQEAESSVTIKEVETVTVQHAYPQVIHLQLSGGFFIVQGRRYAFPRHVLHLNDGETRTLVVTSGEGRGAGRITLRLRYTGGRVMLGDGKRFLRSFSYRDAWQHGERHKGLRLRGKVYLEDVDLYIGSRPPIPLPFGLDEDRGESKERAIREQVERERAKREKAERERAEREQAERERAEREKAKREKAARERAKREEAKRQRAEREKARREKLARDRAEREKAKREKLARERAEREKAKQAKADDKKDKKDKSSEEENGERPECIERGERRSKINKGLPYCDE